MPKSLSHVTPLLLLTVACIGMISVGSSFVLTSTITHRMLQQDAEATTMLARRVVDAERSEAYFLGQKKANSDITEMFGQLAAMSETVQVNVYGLDKTILWSSNRQFTGESFDNNIHLDRALAGNVQAKSRIIKTHLHTEHMHLRQAHKRFVETYIPVKNPNDGKIIGVVELYRIPHALFEAISTKSVVIWSSVGLVGLLLSACACLFQMVRRTFQRMDSRPEQFVPSAIPAPLPEKTSGVADDIRSSRGASPPTACLLQGNQTAKSDLSVRGIQLEVSRFEQQMADLRADCAPRVEQLETVPLGAVIGASLHDLTRETAMRNVTISLQLNGQLPSIKGDVSLLRQALCSVIANALTAMRDGGRIFVEGRIAPDCKHVEIRISNTLVTYPAKQAQRSCRVSRMRSHGSRGVSLAMAQHLVNRLGGSLRIEQHSEGGTTVILTFLTAFP